MTPAEQLFLEYVNRARLDPLAEAARHGIDLNDGLPSGTLTDEARQPLAPNEVLAEASAAHSQWMLDTNTFSHTGAGGSSATDRITAVLDLTPPWATGENLSWSGTTGPLNLDLVIPGQHRGLFESAGHRQNMLNHMFDEIGIAQVAGQFTASNGTTFNASMITNKFVGQGGSQFLTGVIYTDDNEDGFYSIGEGVVGVGITVNGDAVTSAAAGGYALALAAAEVEVSFDWEGTMLSAQVDLSEGNVKLDLVDGLRLMSSGDLVLGDGVIEAGLLGVADLSLTGNESDNVLHVGRGNNVIDGGGGSNIALFSGVQTDYEITIEAGTITVTDQRTDTTAQGTNTLTGIQTLRFSDGDLPGLGDPDPDPDPDPDSLPGPGNGPHALSGTIVGLDGDALGNTTVHLTHDGADTPAHAFTTDVDGAFSLHPDVASGGRLDATRAHDPQEDGRPTVFDALDVLRLAVGLEPSFGPATPEAYVAADMDGNGQIDVFDALEVLRAAVGLESDYGPRWVFVDTEALTEDMDRTSVDYDTGAAIADLTADVAGVDMTGILTGHMHEFA